LARPRIPIDYRKIRELHVAGWGATRIARKVKVSRSLVQRVLRGRRPEGGPVERCDACERRRLARAYGSSRVKSFSASEREHAHELLEIGRGSATDGEFAKAVKRLDWLLDSRPQSFPSTLAGIADDELNQVVEKREEWQDQATQDLAARWATEAGFAKRAFDRLDPSKRWDIDGVFAEQAKRAALLLERRLKDLRPGAVTDSLVDDLVTDGLERAGVAAERLR
jgi:hypothetical protein